MNKLIPINDAATPSRDTVPTGRRLLNAGMAAALAGIVSFATLSHAQESKPVAPPDSTTSQAEHHQRHRDFRHGRHHGPMDPAQAGKRIQHRIDRMLTSVNATAEQKTRVNAIAKAAFDEMRPLRDKNRVNREAQFKLLTQAKIDVDALEKLRQEKLQLDDQRSRIANKAFIDAAVVLTPAQRTELAKQMKQRHDRRMEHGGNGLRKDGMHKQPQK